MDTQQSAVRQVLQIKRMDAPALRAFWESHFNSPAPNSNRAFLRQNLIQAVQEQQFGTMANSSAQLIDDLSKDKQFFKNQGSGRIVDGKDLSLGTKLVRTYEGKDHIAVVVPKGFEYEGVFYKSLSAIAKKVTGTKWNGLVFFGIKKANNKR